jgi:uncharacterized membrane protein
MINELADPRAASAILIGLAQLFVITAGFSLMLSHRRLAGRLFLVGVFLAVVVVVAPGAFAR